MAPAQKQTSHRQGHRQTKSSAFSSALILLLALQALSTLPLAANAQAQQQPQRPSSPPSSSMQYPYRANFSPSMAIIIVVIISTFFVMAFFSLYARPCSSGDEAADGGQVPPTSRAAPRRGVDKETIESFPLLLYSEVENLRSAPLECAVCLSEFEAQESLRLLPRCQHAFHPDCIGMWLDSHTTCPVCRANLLQVAAEGDDKAGDGNEQQQGEVGVQESVQLAPPDHVAITVDQDERGEPEDSEPEGERTATVPPPAPRRSRSVRVAPAVDHLPWTERERERFTLRLPEAMRKEVMQKRRLNRSITMASPLQPTPPLAGGRSLRRGSRGGSGGWSFKMRMDWATKSDRWAFLGKTSFKTSRGEKATETQPEVSVRNGGDPGTANVTSGVCSAV